jgi:TrmH family RNA methyltransferase
MLLHSRAFVMPVPDVVIVLLRPRRAENVAAVCRAMKNMGLSALRLVGPPPELGSSEARGAAYGAWDVLDGAATPPDLVAAVSDATFVVGTSGKADGPVWSPRALAREAVARGGRLAVVFGPEASGLTNEELRLCHATLRIPSDPAQPSLNLAQAVLVVAYELFLARPYAPSGPPAASPVATAGELEAALGELQGALVPLGYLNPQNPEPILAELRALLVRAAPTSREVALLRGLARQLAWAAARTGAARGGNA